MIFWVALSFSRIPLSSPALAATHLCPVPHLPLTSIGAVHPQCIHSVITQMYTEPLTCASGCSEVCRCNREPQGQSSCPQGACLLVGKKIDHYEQEHVDRDMLAEQCCRSKSRECDQSCRLFHTCSRMLGEGLPERQISRQMCGERMCIYVEEESSGQAESGKLVLSHFDCRSPRRPCGCGAKNMRASRCSHKVPTRMQRQAGDSSVHSAES